MARIAVVVFIAGFLMVPFAQAQDTSDLDSTEVELVKVDWFEEMLEGGVSMIALTALSVGLVAFIIERANRLRGAALAPRLLLSSLIKLDVHKDTEGIREACKKYPSVLADIALFLHLHRNADSQILLNAAGDLGARSIMQEERRCQPFAVIAGIAPLLGLLGTMIGMIEAFKLVEVFGDEGGASLLAGSISKALITTAVGLILAIPALIAYHGFKHRAQTIGMQLEVASESLFNNWFLDAQTRTAPTHPTPPTQNAAAVPEKA